MIVGMASTASAYSYSAYFTNSVTTSGSVTLISYVRDANSYARWQPDSIPLDTNYTSRGMYLNGGTYYVYNTQLNSSGGTATHYYYGQQTYGKLNFQNTVVPGYYVLIAGNML